MSCHLGRGFAGTASTFGGVRDSETHFSGNAAHYKKVEILAKLNFNLGCLACFCHYTPRPTHTRGIDKVLLAIYKKNYFWPLISEEYWAEQRSSIILTKKNISPAHRLFQKNIPQTGSHLPEWIYFGDRVRSISDSIKWKTSWANKLLSLQMPTLICPANLCHSIRGAHCAGLVSNHGFFKFYW